MGTCCCNFVIKWRSEDNGDGQFDEGQEENHQAEANENDSIINDNTRDNKEKLENAERHSAAVENDAVEESENERELSSQEEEKENNEAIVNQENVEEIQEGKEGIEREFNQKEAVESENESVKRSVEFPLFLSAAIGDVLVGSWIFLDKRNKRKSPYIIAIFGTLALLGIYIISRTTSIQPVGIKRVGILDSVTTALQVGIVICSGYGLKTWQNRIVKVY